MSENCPTTVSAPDDSRIDSRRPACEDHPEAHLQSYYGRLVCKECQTTVVAR